MLFLYNEVPNFWYLHVDTNKDNMPDLPIMGHGNFETDQKNYTCIAVEFMELTNYGFIKGVYQGQR